MDDTDIASEREEAHRQSALAMTLRQRLATGNGICRLCGDAVESDRLKALPHTPHCSYCASDLEESRARMAKMGAR